MKVHTDQQIHIVGKSLIKLAVLERTSETHIIRTLNKDKQTGYIYACVISHTLLIVLVSFMLHKYTHWCSRDKVRVRGCFEKKCGIRTNWATGK